MKHALLAALLLFPTSAYASPEDDYVACLIGQSAVVLHKQQKKDALEAQEIAYDLCGEKVEVAAISEEENEGLSDYVNLMVERMAAE